MRTVSKFTHFTALIVDDMQAMRGNLRQQLSLLEISQVDQAMNADEAIRALHKASYHLVLCDYNLGSGSTGQQLLEHLREHELLPAQTIFLMCSAENSYNAVVSAAEVQPDDYLLKPFTPVTIENRIERHLARQAALAAAHRSLGAGDHAQAAAACDRVIAGGGRFALDAQRLKGRVLDEAGELAGARALYEAVRSEHDEPMWASLALARCLRAQGEPDTAQTVARALIERHPQCAGAYELLAQLHDDAGEQAATLEVLREAARQVPSARRQRALGEAAYRAGDLDAAQAAFARVLQATRGSLTAQPRDVLQLAQVHVDAGSPAAALAVLAKADRRFAEDRAFEGVLHAVSAQAHSALGDSTSATAAYERAGRALEAADVGPATIALAKAALAVGREDEGLELLERAARAGDGDPGLSALARSVLAAAGRVDAAGPSAPSAPSEAAMAEALALVEEARALMKQAQPEASVRKLDAALARLPDDATVLVAAAQLILLYMTQRGVDSGRLAQLERCLARLDELLPGDERVARMHRFLGDMLAQAAAR